MGKNTLTLKKDPLESIAAESGEGTTAGPAISDDAIAAYLRSKGFTVEQKVPGERSDIIPDRTEHLPTAPSNPFDLSTIPPPGERGSAPVQAPAKTWGNPRLLRSAPPGPQPLFVPPKGR